MRKRVGVLFAATALTALALTACGSNEGSGNEPAKTTSGTTTTNTTTTATGNTTTGNTTTQNTTTQNTSTTITYEQDTKGLDVFINYDGTAGISARDSFQNPIETSNYTKDQVLPVWTYFGNTLKTTIREACDYNSTNDKTTYTTVDTNNYKSQKDSNQKIDLFYNTTENITEMGNSGKAVNLMPYYNSGKMPYFKAYLESHPEVKDLVIQGEGDDQVMYYTPYFDGYNEYEKSIVMNTEYVETILDNDNVGDDSKTNGANADSNVLQAPKFQPFMDDNYNYPQDNTELKITYDGELETIQVKQTTNIIKQQNELLSHGCTGLELANQFRTYLRAAYGQYIGTNKYYEKLSDIFTSQAACYNTDDLIALMRVIKANPGEIVFDDNVEIEILFPRGQEDNRINNILQFAQIFGVQGLASEHNHLFFDGNGTISDADTATSTYEALNYLSQLYDEGLILENFYISANKGASVYLNKYFGHLETSADNDNYGFMTYDFTATTAATNSIDTNNVGTEDEDRAGMFQGSSVTGVMPILPPYSYWHNTSYNNDDILTQSITNKTGKTLMRYMEDNRSVKNNSWCIPTESDNKEKAVQLMDYIFSKQGTMVNDFGTSKYWNQELVVYQGQTTPQLSQATRNWIKSSGVSFWEFMRQNIGATHGIGSVREASLNYTATNQYAQDALTNILTACQTGSVTLSELTTDISWGVTVPSINYGTVSIGSSHFAGISRFWEVNGKLSSTPQGWVKVVTDQANTHTEGLSSETVVIAAADGRNYTYQEIIAQIGARKTEYLYTALSKHYSQYMPQYLSLN